MIKKICAAFAAFMLPLAASAHSFGKLYNLPVPFRMYEFAAAATIIVSFIVVGFFIDDKEINKDGKKMRVSVLDIFISKYVKLALGVGGMFFFVLTLISGFIGENTEYANINMNLFWIWFMLGLSYLTAIFGNIFQVMSPWRNIAKITGADDWEGLFKYPKWLGYYPSVIWYGAIIWFELVERTTPLTLSFVLAQYTFIGIIGSLFFGTKDWFKFGEVFDVFFRMISKISIFTVRDDKVYIENPFSRSARETADEAGLVLFIVFILASTAFDGFKETNVWLKGYWSAFDAPLKSVFGNGSFFAYQTLGVIIAPVVFLSLYVASSWLIKLLTKTNISLIDLMRSFIFSLIPVALAYNVAHYFTLIFSEGPNLVRLISDPFGWGLDIFGSAHSYYNMIIATNVVWHVQVAVIIIGHIIGVYLAHLIALRVFKSKHSALISQIPMLVLMVIYTMSGLWILSQPITGGAL